MISISGPESKATTHREQGCVKLAWRPGLLEQIRCYVGITHVGGSGKGADVGGLLFGYSRGGVMQVMTWRPISRDKDTNMHFSLNGKDERNFQKLLGVSESDRGLKGMEVLGWFRSRTDGEKGLAEADVRFHEKFFAAMHQLAMIIRPSDAHPAEAAVYAKNAEGNFVLSGPLAMADTKANAAEWGATEEEAVVRLRKSTWMRDGLAVLAGLALMLAVILAMQWNHQQDMAASLKDELGFEVELDDSGVKARWNPASATIQKAENVHLQLGRERMQLSHSELSQGYMRVALKNPLLSDTEVSLRAGNREEVSQLIIAAR